MKTIFITAFHSLSARNILNAGVLQRILDAGMRVVLLVPPKKVDYFRHTFMHEHVVIEGVRVPMHPLEESFSFFSYAAVDVQNHFVRGWRKTGFGLKYYTVHALHPILSSFTFFRMILKIIGIQLFTTSALDTLFVRYAPDLVFATDSFYREDRVILNTAAAKGVRTVGMIRSWDNATTKGVFLCSPDRVLTVNDVLKEELVTLHGVRASDITVTGWPHYDSAQRGPHTSRDNFFADMGLNSALKTILFAPGGKILYKHDREMLVMLKRLLDAGKFTHPVQFLVRFPPADIIDTAPIDGDPRFIVDNPGTNITGRKKESEISTEDNTHLENTLHYVDLVLTLVSTMAIDGTVFGKPVVIIGFDAPGAMKQSVRDLARYPHFRKFLKTGLLTVPRSEDALVESINAYLAEPNKNSEARAELVSQYVYKLDGKSAERVATSIIAQL